MLDGYGNGAVRSYSPSILSKSFSLRRREERRSVSLHRYFTDGVISSCAPHERNDAVVNDENLAAHLHRHKITVTNERSDLFDW